MFRMCRIDEHIVMVYRCLVAFVAHVDIEKGLKTEELSDALELLLCDYYCLLLFLLTLFAAILAPEFELTPRSLCTQ